jgi:hypothetical protein
MEHLTIPVLSKVVATSHCEACPGVTDEVNFKFYIIKIYAYKEYYSAIT